MIRQYFPHLNADEIQCMALAALQRNAWQCSSLFACSLATGSGYRSFGPGSYFFHAHSYAVPCKAQVQIRLHRISP